MRKWSIVAPLLLASLSLEVQAAPTPTLPRERGSEIQAAPIPTLPRERRREIPSIAVGLYNPGIPDEMDKVTATEAAIGKPAAILMFYKHWGGAWNDFYAQWVDAVVDRGAVPMITWMSDDYTVAGYPNPRVEGAYANQRIAGGAYDAFIRGWADGLKATGRSVLLRFDHEMNGNWYGWAPGINGNTAACSSRKGRPMSTGSGRRTSTTPGLWRSRRCIPATSTSTGWPSMDTTGG